MFGASSGGSLFGSAEASADLRALLPDPTATCFTVLATDGGARRNSDQFCIWRCDLRRLRDVLVDIPICSNGSGQKASENTS